MLDPRSFRFRTFLAIVLAAVLTAALLRHSLHVYGGIPREEIRWDALVTVFLAVGALGAAAIIRRVWRR